MKKKFIIYNDSIRLYWNNKMGWVDRKSATKFSKREVQLYYFLPLGGKWLKI